VSLARVLPGTSITLSRTSGASGPEQVQAEPSSAADLSKILTEIGKGKAP
jgi:hypothetical protein